MNFFSIVLVLFSVLIAASGFRRYLLRAVSSLSVPRRIVRTEIKNNSDDSISTKNIPSVDGENNDDEHQFTSARNRDTDLIQSISTVNQTLNKVITQGKIDTGLPQATGISLFNF